jgi:hypothetical protein
MVGRISRLPPRVLGHFPLPACGERVRERGSYTAGLSWIPLDAKCGPPLPSPLLQRRRGSPVELVVVVVARCARKGGAHLALPPGSENTLQCRTASRPRLAARSTVRGAGRRFDRRFTWVAAASRDVSRSGAVPSCVREAVPEGGGAANHVPWQQQLRPRRAARRR